MILMSRFKIILLAIMPMTIFFLTGCQDFLVNSSAFFPQKINRNQPPPNDDRFEEIFFESLDGKRLQALHFNHPQSEQIVVFFHGNAGHLYHRISHALELYERGISVFLLSYRGYGKSEGRPSEQGVYKDAQATLNYVRDVLGFEEHQTFILGRSLGSAVAIEVAQDKNLAGLILVTPLSSGRDIARYRHLGWAVGMIGHPFDSIIKVEKLHMPALFIHGDADWVIPLEQGQRLFETYASTNKIFKLVPNGGHLNIIGVAGSDYWDWMQEFVETNF